MADDQEPLLLSDDAREALNEGFDLDEYRMELASIRETAGIQPGVRPPNYHLSSEPETISCGNCEFFNLADLRCTLYDVAVEKNGVSDSWTPPPDF